MAGHHLSMTELSNRVMRMGLSPAILLDAMNDPTFLHLVSQRVEPLIPGTLYDEDIGINGRDDTSQLSRHFIQAKATWIRERSLPPTIVPPAPRLFLLNKFRRTRHSKSRYTLRQTYIGMVPEHSELPWTNLERSESAYTCITLNILTLYSSVSICQLAVRKRHEVSASVR